MKATKKDLLCGSLFVFTLFLCTPVYSIEAQEPGWFMTGKVGKASVADSYDELNYGGTRWEFSHDYNYAISLGYEIETFSLEAEYSHRRLDAERRICPTCDSVEYKVINLAGYQTQRSMLLMGTWFPIQNRAMKPFLGLGAGYTKIRWDTVRYETEKSSSFYGSDTVFTYKIAAGVEFPVRDNLAIMLAYNYLTPDHVEIYDVDTRTAGKLNKQEINIIDLGIKYRF